MTGAEQTPSAWPLRLRARWVAAANAVGAAALFWLAAPLLRWNGLHPLDPPGTRGLALLVLAAATGASLALWLHAKQRRNDLLFAGMQGSSVAAAGELGERFAHAARLLRTGITRAGYHPPRWWQARQQVYQLPWYVIIGAPGAGKTTALLRSGLRFPLAERLGAAPVAGVGGTRQCDWWFTDQAVFIDTAGRYTTQDSDASTDAGEWRVFMNLLRRHRPVQPINGVIVTVSVPDLLRGGSELDQQAAAVDRRLQELRDTLDLSFPVYVLVTKVDLLAGFAEFFGDANAERREQAWGIGLAYPPAPGCALPDDLAEQLAALPAHLVAMMPRRLQEEPLPENRTALFHFPAQVEALLPQLLAFARQALAHTAVQPAQPVRGIHLTSGTQEGNPIDRVLGALSRTYGTALADAPRRAKLGKAFFLAELLRDLVIAEAPLAGRALARMQQRRWWQAACLGLLAGVVALACAGWWLSVRQNLAYVAAVQARVHKVMRDVAPQHADRIGPLLPLYATLRQLASSGEVDPEAPALGIDFGLFQGPRLARSAEQTYQRVLEQTLAPLLAQRLTQDLRNDADPVARYAALRVGLMLTQPGRLDRQAVRSWALQAFGQGPAGQAVGPGERQEWLAHLDALLERNAMQAVLRLDAAVVRQAQAALAALPVEQRIHERLLAQASVLPEPAELSLSDLAGPGAVLLFTPPDRSLPTLPALHTRQAWQTQLAPRVSATVLALADEAAWVLGQPLAPDAATRDALAHQVAVRHALATAAHWERLLGSLSLQLPADAEGFARAARQLGAPMSPLRQWVARLADEFGPGTGPSSVATRAYDQALGLRFAALRDYARERAGGVLDANLSPLAQALREPGAAATGSLVQTLRLEAQRTPQPLRQVWAGLADGLARHQREALERQLGSGLAELGQACRRLTQGRFPFASGTERDMPLAEFARLFGPGGQFDSYFRNHLAAKVDTRGRPWRLVADDLAPPRLKAVLQSFEQAHDIRRLFFATAGELPQLRLNLTPVAMDPELLQFSLDVDGQMLRYENGPRRARTVLWPGPAASERVVMRILPATPQADTRQDTGPWALLRVLLQHGWRRGDQGAALARLDVDGRTLTVAVGAEGPVPVSLLPDLPRFRCPEGL